MDVAPKLRWAILALLVTAPAVAAAQQQQGGARDSDQLSREAALGLAQMLARAGRLADAVKAYERWVERHPKDIEVAELLALALSRVGRLDDAERLYKLLAAIGSLDAERGLARLTAWRGDLLGSERQWRAIVAKRPGDAEAWVGLAQVLRWRNRPRDARAALTRALAADARNRDAAEQLRWVQATLALHVDPVVASMNDSDGSRVMTVGAAGVLAAPWDGELSVRAQRRAAVLGAARASSLNAGVAASRNVGRYAFRGSLGATRLDDASTAPGGVTRDVLTGGAGVSALLGRRTHVAGVIARDAFDETALLMRRGIVSTTFGAGTAIDLGPRLSLSGEMEHARLSGGTPNSRTSGSGSLTWRAPRVLSLATKVRGFGYATNPFEGYFAPRRYLLAETSAQLAVGGELGWSATLDGGVGAQSIDAGTLGSATRPASRGGLSILYRPAPGLECGVSGTIANAASPATSSLTSYRATGVSVKARVSF
jgi:tetratricopeptide (TPR) repeat protein